MPNSSLRQKIGVILKDWPGFEREIRGKGQFVPRPRHWTLICNRNEEIRSSPDGHLGVVCLWKWTSDLHACKVFPSLGVRLFKAAFAEWPVRFKEAPANVQRSEDDIDISFIIGHRGTSRLPHLLTTLRSLASQKKVSLECIVVEQSKDPDIRDLLPPWVRYVFTPLPHPEMPYCRSWAFNVGAREAIGRILVFHDNDICIPISYSEELKKLYAKGFRAMRLQRFVFYLDESTTSTVLKKHRIPENIQLDRVRQNCEGHTIAVDRDTYFQLGGHDEAFIGWGGEDNEFFQRCQTIPFYSYMYLPFIHLHHPFQPGKRGNNGRETAELLETRSVIPPEQRIAELSSRNFGHPGQLDPSFGTLSISN